MSIPKVFDYLVFSINCIRYSECTDTGVIGKGENL